MMTEGTRHDGHDGAEAALFAGAGEMPALFRAHDWGATPLGPAARWPEGLRAVVGLVLRSPLAMVVLWGPDLVQLYNDGYRAVMGAKHPAGLGQPTRECWPEVWAFNAPLYEGVVRRGEAFTFEDQRLVVARHGFPEEAFFTLTFSPVPDGAGAVGGVLVTVVETSAGVRARAAVAEAARRAAELAAVIESIPDAVYIGSADGITLANQSALDQLGYATRAELNRGIGTLAAEIQTRDAATGAFIAPAEQAFARALGGERVVQDVVVRHRGTGEDRVVRCAAAPVVVDGRVIAAVAVNTDVTALRRAAAERERLLEAERRARADAEAAREAAVAASRAKGDFLAVMSHEFRTPLNAIAGYAELIEMGVRGPVTEAQREDLARIQRSQRHLLGLVNEVLNYAKLGTASVHYDVAAVPVRDALAAAEGLVAPQVRAKGLALAVAECPADLAVRADAEKVRQVLVNLLSNAVKFTDHRAGVPGRIELACDAEAECVRLVVRDTGMGIAAEQLERVFEPFVQVRADLTRTADGTGLGLAISRDLARGMGGEITVESTPGVGSTFTVTLPRA